jgi:mono/diheme cytochrome c family protein
MIKPPTGVAAALATALLVGAAGARAADAPKGDAAKGKQHFLIDGCAFCHGTVGQGGGGRTGGLRLASMGIGFAAFLNQLRHPVNEMPPYVAAALTDQDVADLYAYVAGLPPPPDVKSIPILNN